MTWGWVTPRPSHRNSTNWCVYDSIYQNSCPMTVRVGLVWSCSTLKMANALGGSKYILAEPRLTWFTRTQPHTQTQLDPWLIFMVLYPKSSMWWYGQVFVLIIRLTHSHPYPLFILINTLPVGYTKNFHRCTPHARLHVTWLKIKTHIFPPLLMKLHPLHATWSKIKVHTFSLLFEIKLL